MYAVEGAKFEKWMLKELINFCVALRAAHCLIAAYSVFASAFDIGIAHSITIDSAKQGSIKPFACVITSWIAKPKVTGHSEGDSQ